MQARLTSHYSTRRAFFASEDELLASVQAIRHLRCIAVQGGNDLVCPPTTAYELHQAWPEMDLRVVPGAGHSMYDGGIQKAVLDATDELREQGAQTAQGEAAPPGPGPVVAAAETENGRTV